MFLRVFHLNLFRDTDIVSADKCQLYRYLLVMCDTIYCSKKIRFKEARISNRLFCTVDNNTFVML